MIDSEKIKAIVEGALLAADGPLTVEQIVKLFKRTEISREDARNHVRAALEAIGETLATDGEGRGVELLKVASGYRMQVRQELSPWISRLWDEKPPRYTRALLETLSLIAYKQPVTRGDIEQVRGVSVSQNIMRTLLERGWVKVVGQREVPGRPSMYGTTKAFLDYFGLKTLNQLPPLAEIKAMLEPMVVTEEGEDVTIPEATATDSDAAAEANSESTSEVNEEPSEETPEPELYRAEVVQLPTSAKTSSS